MRDQPPTSIGQNVRAARRRIDPAMSVAGLAGRAGCSPALVSRIETGAVVPSIGTLEALAGALHVSVAELVDRDGPSRRAEAAIALARTVLLLGRAADLTEVIQVSVDPGIAPEWRGRALALIATAMPPGPAASAAAAEADDCLNRCGDAIVPSVAARARIEVAYAVGEDAWARGDFATASRRWGNGLAVVAPAGDIEAMWARALIARALARATPGTRTATNALGVAVEALALIADPIGVATRMASSPIDGAPVSASLALAIVGAAQVALADVRARLAALTDASSVSGTAARSDMPLGRHLR